ncbi:hypothetical protein Verru16b_01604 [Lacunisphaera limnophila]|uniref:Uncharacterized protein n=2 Tax=Lacunisphaera limnophila TaxID=1838286 RepID=A0A1D8AUH3_9BACT|nr:hypothetical protein Verru16b_01604 [Lacunisphaera limnophila]
MRDKSNTADELAHLTGGYTFNRYNDYRMHPENGNLPQRWQALPAVIMGATYPDLQDPNWRESNVWQTGHRFFFGAGNNPARMLTGARAMNALFGAAVLLLVPYWAWHLFGPAGALVALVFGATCPTLLAHSGLATSDMAMAFFLLAAVSAWWWHLHDPRRRVLALSAVTFGLACVAKFSAVLLPPLFGLLTVAALLVSRSAPRLRWRPFGFSLLTHGLAAFLIIWAAFGFRYSAFNPALPAGEFNLAWDYVLSFGGLKAAVVSLCRDWRLLPEGFLYGLMFVLKHAEARGAFLDGDYSIFGWVSFFPKAFLYKTTPALLVAVTAAAAGLALWARERGIRALGFQLRRVLPLLVLFATYWGISLASHLNIGHRHILPTYPVLYVATGVIGWMIVRAWRSNRAGGWLMTGLAALLAGWQVADLRAVHPHYLAYFSPIVGGPAQGYHHLVDSSLDWGQDLPGLKRWLEENHRPQERLHLSYFGTAEPDYYGIQAVRMPMIHGFRIRRPWHRLEPGLYAISATMLQHVYMGIRGPWTPAQEERYQKFRALAGVFESLNGPLDPAAAPINDLTAAEWNQAWDQYEQLRFARLCHYLRVRRPEAMIGYSILIFRLDQAELDRVLHGSARDLGRAIEAAAGPLP